VKNELDGMWKAAAMVYIRVLSRYLSGGTEESQENPQSEESSGISAEIRICHLRNASHNRYHLSQLVRYVVHIVTIML
jgi:hypothetical protein